MTAALPENLRFGRYQILRRVAYGGMAEIFLGATAGLLGVPRLVALKRILPQLAVQEAFVSMFLDEARIAAMLDHANIVRVFDVDSADGSYFIAMEYLQGETLKTIMTALEQNPRRLPLPCALGIAINVLAGLHYAHEKLDPEGQPLAIVHRDVSPQNVLVTYDGSVKLLDFGIAKAQNRIVQTAYGTLKGKIPYMSPEQCRGEELDRRSDIFSVGILLYELSTGKRLYSRNDSNEYEMLRAIIEHEVPSPCALDPAYPPPLSRILLRALSKDRAARHATARELQTELEDLALELKLRISPGALQDFLASLFPAMAAERQKLEAADLSLASRLIGPTPRIGSGPIALQPTLPGAASTSAPRAVVQLEAEFEAAVTVEHTPSKQKSETPDLRRRSRLAVPLFAGLFALAGLAGALVWRTGHVEPAPPAPPVTSSVPPPIVTPLAVAPQEKPKAEVPPSPEPQAQAPQTGAREPHDTVEHARPAHVAPPPKIAHKGVAVMSASHTLATRPPSTSETSALLPAPKADAQAITPTPAPAPPVAAPKPIERAEPQAAAAAPAPPARNGSVEGTVGPFVPHHGVVWLEGTGLARGGTQSSPSISQRGARFQPDFVVLSAGQTLQMPNDDRIVHNVFSASPAKKFDLGHYPEGELRTVKFESAGIIDLFCNIHDNMHATVVVTPNRFHTQISDGHFKLDNVPAGTWRVVFYSPESGEQSSSVTVAAGATANVSFSPHRR